MGWLSKLTGGSDAKAAQGEAVKALEEAAARNVNVQLSPLNMVKYRSEQEALEEENAKRANKRKMTLGSTLRSGLLGGGTRMTLG